jgi:adenylosuccinate lyase
MIDGSTCSHERAHITDSRFYGHNYGTDASRAIFCDVCRYQRWLDYERELALAQAELGIVPQAAADAIAAAAHVELLDLERVAADIRHTRHSLVGLLRGLQAACPDGAGDYVHLGATTQDVQDTAQALEMRDVLDQLQPAVERVAARLADLAEEHAGTVIVGRTHAQPALPTTFGLKVAGWVDELMRHVDRLDALRERALVVQCFGGVGTMAAFGDRAPELLERLAARLGLGVPATSWHVVRDRVAEYVLTLSMVAQTIARIADEVRILSRPEFGELRLAWYFGKVGSSTMPHKRNPEECEQIVVLARLAAAQAALGLQAMVVEHERDSRELRLEWVCVAEVSHYTLCAARIVEDVVGGLEVDVERMAENARVVSEPLSTEALMFALAGDVGKQAAYSEMYELAQAAQSEGRPLRELLEGNRMVRDHLTGAQLDDIMDPAKYVGQAQHLVAGVVEAARARLGAPAAAGAPD